MRVLITAGFLGHFGETDGVTTTYRNLLGFYERSGLEADVVAYGPEDATLGAGRVRMHVHRPRVALQVDPRRWIDLAFGATRLARRLASERYDVVQSSTPDPMGVWAQGVARGACPFVAFYHTALGEYAEIRGRHAAGALGGRLLGFAMERWLQRYFDAADLILAPSHSVEQDLAARFRAPVAVLGRGVDCVEFDPAKRRRAAGPVRALYVGRVAPEKNLDLLAQVFTRGTDCELMIVGDGPHEAALRHRLPRALFAGRLEGEALARAYADADFFVFPSRTDTLGNVVLEAMASGLPAVVSDSMGPKELVAHGATGFVARSDAEFARAVVSLATDHQRRRSMGVAARRFAQTRSWAAIFEGLMEHYRQLVAAPLAA